MTTTVQIDKTEFGNSLIWAAFISRLNLNVKGSEIDSIYIQVVDVEFCLT